MERLTEKHYLGADHYMKCSENCDLDMDCIDCPSFDRLVERLAAYEDTGLTPEEIVKMGMAYEDSKRYSRRLERRLKAYEEPRLRELALADKEGRVVVLPCKIGDRLYRSSGNKSEVYEFEIDKHFANQMGISIFAHCVLAGERLATSYESFKVEDIGKTVFLTREEAEKAFEAMKK